VASESGKKLKTKLFYLIILAIEGKPCVITFWKLSEKSKTVQVVYCLNNEDPPSKLKNFDA